MPAIKTFPALDISACHHRRWAGSAIETLQRDDDDDDDATTHDGDDGALDEGDWIWHTEKSALKRLSDQELLDFCHGHQLHRVNDLLRGYMESLASDHGDNQFSRTKIINITITERNLRRKMFPQYKYKFDARQLLGKKEEMDLLDAHTPDEIRRMCRTYAVRHMAGKKMHTLVRNLVKAKKRVTDEEEWILQKHGKDLKHLNNEMRLGRLAILHKPTKTPLALARRLDRSRRISVALHDKLAQFVSKQQRERVGGDDANHPESSSLPPELQMSDDLSWEEQLLFFRKWEKRKLIYNVLGIDSAVRGECSCASDVRYFCRLLKINKSKI
ncbi:hypothetical protein ACHAWF_004876 [Thalassiosira exigua]